MMIRTQIQLPDELYHEAKRVAREQGVSLAEVVRRGVEYITSANPPPKGKRSKKWKLPPPVDLGEIKVPLEDLRLYANDPTLIGE